MHVMVAGLRYEIRVVSGWVYLNGERCYGTCDHDAQVIRISGAAQPDRRLLTLKHEVWHAWEELVPLRLESEEDRARAFAAVASSIDIDVRDLQPPDNEPITFQVVRILLPQGTELKFQRRDRDA